MTAVGKPGASLNSIEFSHVKTVSLSAQDQLNFHFNPFFILFILKQNKAAKQIFLVIKYDKINELALTRFLAARKEVEELSKLAFE